MELQQIIEGLNCFKTNQHPCATCPWNPHPGMAWPYGCIKGQSDVIEAAQELLKDLAGFKAYFDGLYGQGLEVANWHMNGTTEPFDNFYESASEAAKR